MDTWITEVRNEMGSSEEAYAGVIERVVELTEPSPNAQPSKEMYLLGESHILPLCWKNVNVERQGYTLIPRLVMGLKAFYFKPGFSRREAVILRRHMAKIPEGASVIVVAGEIDCRPYTGILAAVEKGKYRDIHQGVATTAFNFVEGLAAWMDGSLGLTRPGKVIIHPVRPPTKRSSLQERDLIQELNVTIDKMVRDREVPGLRFLDLLPTLSKDGFLLEQFHSGDEVHLNSEYVPLLQDSIERTFRQ
eukprot:TRINITY_DN7278_c0_g1_i4.p2 TRINITY_DN7278_c0_g1~~TRINITY_DN7278_c0_g1_i4.p2  ORF type:complete len:248 (-),score=36.25 TRINITY_DN7278_c0_g1_i4:1020-1763(-)